MSQRPTDRPKISGSQNRAKAKAKKTEVEKKQLVRSLRWTSILTELASMLHHNVVTTLKMATL